MVMLLVTHPFSFSFIPKLISHELVTSIPKDIKMSFFDVSECYMKIFFQRGGNISRYIFSWSRW